MPGAHQPEEQAWCKALIHSVPGNGKTYLLGSAQDDERCYPAIFLDMEAGTNTLVGRDIDVKRVRDWQDYNEAHAYLVSDANEYRCALIDSVSETQAFGLLNILDQDKKRPDPNILAEADWGVILIQMRRFVRHFRDLPMHVFMTAQSGEATVPRLGKVMSPLLQGKFATDLPGIVDVVGYLAMDEWTEGDQRFVQRSLLLQNNPRFLTKVRKPMGLEIPDEIADPTIGSLLDVLGYAKAA